MSAINRRSLVFGSVGFITAGIAGGVAITRKIEPRLPNGMCSFIVGQRITLDYETRIKDAVIMDCEFTCAFKNYTDLNDVLSSIFDNCALTDCRFEMNGKISAPDYNSEWKLTRVQT